MRRVAAMALVMAACNPEPKPGEPGWYDCDAYPVGPGCETVDICCEVLDDYDTLCAYETQSGQRFECVSELNCTAAAEDMVCAVCDFADTPYNTVCQ